jgi:hypothetical protein
MHFHKKILGIISSSECQIHITGSIILKEKFVQNPACILWKQQCFQKNWPLIFYFFPYFYFCIPFNVGSASKSVSGSGTKMHAVPVPLGQKLLFLRFRVPQHRFTRFISVSLYGEWLSETWEPVPCNQMCDNCDKSGGSAIPTDVTSNSAFLIVVEPNNSAFGSTGTEHLILN